MASADAEGGHSYNKEILTDQFSYIHLKAQMTDRHPYALIDDVERDAVTAVERCRNILAGYPAARKAYKNLEVGFMSVFLAYNFGAAMH